MVLAGDKMGSIAAMSAHLRRAAPRSAVSLAGGKTGAVAASAACLRRAQGPAKVLADPLPWRWCHGGTAALSAVAEMSRSRTRRCELDTQQAKCQDLPSDA